MNLFTLTDLKAQIGIVGIATGLTYLAVFGPELPHNPLGGTPLGYISPEDRAAIEASPAVTSVERVHPEASGYRIQYELPNTPGAGMRVLAFDIGVVPCQIKLDNKIPQDPKLQELAPGAQIMCM